MEILKKITQMAMPYWPRIAGGIILSLMVSGITGAIAWLTKPALDVVFVEKKYEYLKFLPLAIFVLFTGKGLLGFGQSYLMRSSGMKLVRDMRNRLYSHLLSLPVGFFGRESSGSIISRIMNDVEALQGLLSHVVKTFVVEVPTVIFLLGVALSRSWDLTLITLVLLPFIAYNTRKFGKRVKKKRKEAQKNLAVLTHRLGETILGARVIKIFNREDAMSRGFDARNQQYYREMMRVIRFKEFTNIGADVFTGIGIAFVIWYGGAMVIKGGITAGDFASIIVAIYMIFSPVKKIGDAYTSLQETRASMERIDTLLAASQEEDGNVRIPGFRESIEFRSVSFAYPGVENPVLKDVNLAIRRGEVIAVVGRSGVGKSTLIDLIPRFYRVSAGVILIDGVDVNDVESNALRGLIGIVSQDVVLFNDTVRENIAFGRPDATTEEIRDAAASAYADEFIELLPERYDTMIGERGLKLSGGQRQRIAIARAVLKNPPILILDEATSSLDSVSEALVQKALERLMTGRTTIVIAHRLSTIRNADRIVVLDRGTIADVGSHDELVARSEAYLRLYKAYAPA